MLKYLTLGLPLQLFTCIIYISQVNYQYFFLKNYFKKKKVYLLYIFSLYKAEQIWATLWTLFPTVNTFTLDCNLTTSKYTLCVKINKIDLF